MARDILIVVALLFALGAVLIALLRRLAGPARAPDRLWRLYGLQLLIAASVLLPAYLGGDVWLAALLLLALRAQYEFLELHAVGARTVEAVAAQALGGLAVLAAAIVGAGTAALLLGLGLAALLVLTRVAAARPAVAAAGLLFPAAAIAALALYDRLADGFAWLALVYILVEVNDSFAYLFGRAFGERRLLPRLSPNKTWLGLAAGLAAALAVGLALNAWIYAMPWGRAVAVIVVIAAGALAGDLLTSGLKRRAGRKDFAPVLAAHGGVLDIYDSLLLAAPLFLLAERWLPG